MRKVGWVFFSSPSNLNFQVSGTVTTIDVSTGQTVIAGQVLATVDSSATGAGAFAQLRDAGDIHLDHAGQLSRGLQ